MSVPRSFLSVVYSNSTQLSLKDLSNIACLTPLALLLLHVTFSLQEAIKFTSRNLYLHMFGLEVGRFIKIERNIFFTVIVSASIKQLHFCTEVNENLL